MIKTTITQENNSLCLAIPNNYVGKEIEVLLYAKDELEQEKVKAQKTMTDFAGILSEKDYQSLKSHT